MAAAMDVEARPSLVQIYNSESSSLDFVAKCPALLDEFDYSHAITFLAGFEKQFSVLGDQFLRNEGDDSVRIPLNKLKDRIRKYLGVGDAAWRALVTVGEFTDYFASVRTALQLYDAKRKIGVQTAYLASSPREVKVVAGAHSQYQSPFRVDEIPTVRTYDFRSESDRNILASFFRELRDLKTLERLTWVAGIIGFKIQPWMYHLIHTLRFTAQSRDRVASLCATVARRLDDDLRLLEADRVVDNAWSVGFVGDTRGLPRDLDVILMAMLEPQAAHVYNESLRRAADRALLVREAERELAQIDEKRAARARDAQSEGETMAREEMLRELQRGRKLLGDGLRANLLEIIKVVMRKAYRVGMTEAEARDHAYKCAAAYLSKSVVVGEDRATGVLTEVHENKSRLRETYLAMLRHWAHPIYPKYDTAQLISMLEAIEFGEMSAKEALAQMEETAQYNRDRRRGLPSDQRRERFDNPDAGPNGFS